MVSYRYSVSKTLTAIALLIAFAMQAGLSVTAEAADRIRIQVNGSELADDRMAPVIVNNSVYVPLRAVFEALGATIEWNSQERKVTGVYRDSSFILLLDSNRMIVDGHETILEPGVILERQRTLIPLRAAGKALGSRVYWDQVGKTVRILLPSEPPAVTNLEPTDSSGSPIDFVDESYRSRTVLLASPESMEAWLTPDQRRIILYDVENKVSVGVDHYGVEDDRLYTHIDLMNESDEEVVFSLRPGDWKVIVQRTLKADSLPQRPEGCSTEAGQISSNSDCIQYGKDMMDWIRDNKGSLDPDGMLTRREYVQEQDGSLRDFRVAPSETRRWIISSGIGEEPQLEIRGSYKMASANENPVPFTLNYKVDKGMGLENYKALYTFNQLWGLD